MNSLFIALVAMFSLTLGGCALPPKPDSDRLKADSRRLNDLEKVFKSTTQFGEQFWHASKRLADQRGPAIIHAVMVRSQKWQGEEGLIFVPLVALLPRRPSLQILHQYQRSKLESDRIWSREFIIEFEMSDTMEMVARYSQTKQ